MIRNTFTIFKIDGGYAIKAYYRFLFFSVPVGWEANEKPWNILPVKASFDAKSPVIIYPTIEAALEQLERRLIPAFCPAAPRAVLNVGRDEFV